MSDLHVKFACTRLYETYRLGEREAQQVQHELDYAHQRAANDLMVKLHPDEVRGHAILRMSAMVPDCFIGSALTIDMPAGGRVSERFDYVAPDLSPELQRISIK